MLQYMETVQESFEKHVLGALVRAEQGNKTQWETVEKQLRGMSPEERKGLLKKIESKGFLEVIDDPQGNFVVSLTDAGRDYVNG